MQITRKLARSPWLLVILFLLPAFTDLLRKTIPGQPNLVTPLISTFFAIVCYVLTIRNKKKVPTKLIEPIIVYSLFLLIYLIITMCYSFKVFIAAALLRFIPFLIPIIVYKLIDSFEKYEGLMLWVVLFLAFLLPISLYSILMGNEHLPKLLQPIDIIQELGRDKRANFDICSAIFSTGAIMGFAVISLFFLLLAAALVKATTLKWLYLTGAICGIVIMYSTVRRSTLYFSAIGILFYIYLASKKGFLIITLFSLLIFLLFLVEPENYIINKESTKKTTGIVERLSIFIDGIDDAGNRLNNIAFGIPIYWFTIKPFGTFLGYAGREAFLDNVPNHLEYHVIETGAAQLIAETGFLGLTFYIVVFIWIWKSILKYSVNTKYRDSITMLFIGNMCLALMYLLQMVTIQFGMYISHIVYWAMPGFAWALIKSEKMNKNVNLIN